MEPCSKRGRVPSLPHQAYLDRLGLVAQPPSAAALFAIHRRHVERVPYETLWTQLGEDWGIEPKESMIRIATTHRGGYCYHLNGSLSELLLTLGYRVTRHVGGVHGPLGASQAEMSNHLVLTVDGLPTEENPGGTWYVDVGLGDALYEPLPLIAGSYRQGPFKLSLERTEQGVGDWHLTHDPAGGFAGMAWRSEPAEIESFTERHVWHSTSPESGFVRLLTAQRRDATGADILRGLSYRRIGQDACERTLETEEECFSVLRDIFSLDVESLLSAARSAVWQKVLAAHIAWEKAGRP